MKTMRGTDASNAPSVVSSHRPDRFEIMNRQQISRDPAAALHLVLVEEQYRAMSAEELLGLYLDRGDELAFATIVRRYGPLLLRACRSTLPREDLAHEAFQETFRLLVQRGTTIRKRGKLGSWLLATSRRQCLNVLRHEHRRMRREKIVAVPEAFDDPIGGMEIGERGRVLSRALSSLPDRYRAPLELVYLDVMTHAEAARSLGMPKGTLDANVSRGLKRLHRALVTAGYSASVLTAAFAELPVSALPPELVATVVGEGRAVVPLPASAGWADWLAAHKWTIGVAGVAIAAVPVGIWARKADDPKVDEPVVATKVVEESLSDKNLRILRETVAPKICDHLTRIALAGGRFEVEEIDSFDTRVRCVVRVKNEKKMPGIGAITRLAFFYDTTTTICAVYMDAMGSDKWKQIDLSRPLVLFGIPQLNWEWSIKMEPLQQSVRELESIPRDPRGQPLADQRFLELRRRAKQYAGTWYRAGRADQVARVEVDDSLAMRFYRPGETRVYLGLEGHDVWHSEERFRFPTAKREDGFIAYRGIYLSQDLQKIEFDTNEPAWHRHPLPKSK